MFPMRQKLVGEKHHDSIQSDWGNAVPWLTHSPRKLKFETANHVQMNVQIYVQMMSR